jgi:signal transduction histidine kinase
VSTDIAENLQVYGDTKLLRQILDNLLENCYRYTSAAGTVSVCLSG